MVKSEGGQQVFQESKQRKHLSKYVRRWIIAVCAVVIVIGGFVTWRVVSGRNERQANEARVVDYLVRNYEGIETIEFTSYNKQWVAGYEYTSERVNGAPIRIAVVLDTGEVMKPKHSDISENTMDDVKLGWLHDRRYGVKKENTRLREVLIYLRDIRGR